MNSKKLKSIMAILLLAIVTISLTSISTTQAQSSGQSQSYAFIAVEPNPVGIGQTTYIAMWVDVPLPDATEANNIRRHDYKLDITAPDGTTQTKTWAVISDTTGVQSTSFTPTQTGTYTFTFTYPDQIYTWNASATQIQWYGTKFLGDNATTTLTVQQDAVSPTANSPLPTEYWTRPIYGEDYNWYTMGSQWLGGNYLGSFQEALFNAGFGGWVPSWYNIWQQGGTGPGSSHILWTTPLESGGVVGGINTGINGATYYSGGSYEGRFQNSIILDGKLYYKASLSNSATGGAYTCIDLRTGQILWTDNAIYPTFGELYAYESPNQHGVVPNGYLWQTVSTSPTTQTWIAYDPDTGRWLFNLTGVPSTGSIAYTQNGEIVKYILNYNTQTKSGWLALWNWTCANNTALGLPGSGSNALQFRPVGKSIDCSGAYSWNISITADLTGFSPPSIFAVLPGDIALGTSFTMGSGATRGTNDPYTVWALSLKDSDKGQLLWKKSYAAPAGNLTRMMGPLDPVNRVWTMSDGETMQWLGYSLSDGSLLWGPTNIETRSWQFFGGGTGMGQGAVTAYGNIYVQGYGGEIFCYNTKTGALLWKFNDTDSGVDTSWGLMPLFISAIADGKVYAFNNEHSPNSPLYKGYSIYCINATTGEEIYKMLSWSGQSGGNGANTALLADGTLVYFNYYDNQIYAIAKGPSQTTVTAPNIGTELGKSVLISGTVTDISAGTSQNEQAKRFPNGVPVASDASTSAWMEYVYMDQEKPSNFTGVQVTLNVVDANGNYRTIGTATTDSYGFYSLQWTPDIDGKYTVIATFTGNNGYYGSTAETAMAIDPAIATATPQATPAPSAADLYFLPMSIAIIIAIIVIGAILALLVRKKP